MRSRAYYDIGRFHVFGFFERRQQGQNLLLFARGTQLFQLPKQVFFSLHVVRDVVGRHFALGVYLRQRLPEQHAALTSILGNLHMVHLR